MSITTIYDGVEYRSRLEARWASFFTKLYWPHTYEPFDGDGYIPDFVIHGDSPLLVEIKPATTLAEFTAPIEKVTAGVRQHWQHDILILGLTPLPSIHTGTWDTSHPVAGLLGERFDTATYGGEIDSWDFATGNWLTCGKCRQPGISHEYQAYTGRPCGHRDGDHYMGSPDVGFLHQAWAEACNDVKWRGRAA